MTKQNASFTERRISRRELLRLAGVTTVGMVASACVPAGVQTGAESGASDTAPAKERVSIVATSQMPTVLSEPAEARNRPHGPNETPMVRPLCFASRFMTEPVAVFQIRTAPSSPPAASSLPFRLKDTRRPARARPL